MIIAGTRPPEYAAALRAERARRAAEAGAADVTDESGAKQPTPDSSVTSAVDIAPRSPVD